MSLKKYVKRGIEYVRKGVPTKIVKVPVAQIQYGSILEGRNVLITGASRGIGLEVAKKCLKEGASVLITSRHLEDLEAVKEKLNNNRLYIKTHDISDIDSHKLLLDYAYEKMGRVDDLVNNAGVSVHNIDWNTCTPDQWDLQIDTNLKGTYFLTQQYIKHYVKSKQTMGNIIIMSSERGLYGDDVPYGLAKAALNSYTIGLSKKLILKGIRVNGVAPGVTATEFTGHDPDGNLFRRYARGRRVLLSEEIAETTVFLLSNAANSISGQIIACNEANHFK